MIVFSAPSRYVQGAGVLDELGAQCLALGSRAAVVLDAGVAERLGPRITASCERAGLPLRVATFAGEVTQARIDALLRVARTADADVVIGVGGGKALDAAKAVALTLGARFASVPTIASTDAPASFSIAVYDDAHALIEVRKLPRNPELVLVDTAVIAAAPLRFLRAGIGDAISKKFEAEAAKAANAATLHGAQPSHTGLLTGELCYQLIRRHGEPALQAIAEGRVTADVEALVEATTLLSTLSFENGGLSIAHAIARGVPMVPRAAGSLHGEHVAYGLLVQLVLERREPAFIDEMLGLYRALGLPRSLAALQLPQPTAEELQTLVDGALGSPSLKRFVRELGADDLQAAIAEVEALSA